MQCGTPSGVPFSVWGLAMVPEIKTERLILRAMVREDFTAFAAIWAEPNVVRYISGKAVSEAES